MTMRYPRLYTIAALVAWVVICAAIASLFTGCGPDECESCGGHWERYDCHEEDDTFFLPDGNGGGIWMPTTDTVCKRRCVGRRPYREVRGQTSTGAPTTWRTCAGAP